MAVAATSFAVVGGIPGGVLTFVARGLGVWVLRLYHKHSRERIIAPMMASAIVTVIAVVTPVGQLGVSQLLSWLDLASKLGR